MSIGKRGQGWSLDLIIAAVLFLLGIVILYFYAINYSSQAQQHLDELFYEGNLASELILSEQDFGILTDERVNQTKLDEYYPVNNYNSKKITLGVTKEFYFTMKDLEENTTGTPNPIDYIGINGTATAENVVKIERVTIYKNKPAKFELYVWG